jgi:hypothetical protein
MNQYKWREVDGAYIRTCLRFVKGKMAYIHRYGVRCRQLTLGESSLLKS